MGRRARKKGVQPAGKYGAKGMRANAAPANPEPPPKPVEFSDLPPELRSMTRTALSDWIACPARVATLTQGVPRHPLCTGCGRVITPGAELPPCGRSLTEQLEQREARVRELTAREYAVTDDGAVLL